MAQPMLLDRLEILMLAHLAHIKLGLESREPANAHDLIALEEASYEATMYFKRDGYPEHIFADD